MSRRSCRRLYIWTEAEIEKWSAKEQWSLDEFAMMLVGWCPDWGSLPAMLRPKYALASQRIHEAVRSGELTVDNPWKGTIQ